VVVNGFPTAIAEVNPFTFQMQYPESVIGRKLSTAISLPRQKPRDFRGSKLI